MAKLRAAKGKPKKVGAAKKKTVKSMISKYKYIIQDSEAGNFIDKYITLNEAKKALINFETQDKKEGIYKPYFYEIKNLNSKKIGGAVKKAAKKKTIKQTGTSNKVYDKRFSAKPPGKRKSKSGNIYTEKRANRSDKGRLLGIGNITMDKLHKVNKDIINMELALDKNIKTSKLFPYKTPFWKKRLAKNKKIIKNFIIELKKHKTELKKLL